MLNRNQKNNKRLNLNDLDVLRETLSTQEVIASPSVLLDEQSIKIAKSSRKEKNRAINIIISDSELKKLDSIIYKLKLKGYFRVNRSSLIRLLIKDMEESDLKK